MLQNIQKAFKENKVLYTSHAKHEMETEAFGTIYDEEVFESIITGEIIEDYPSDTPYPSCLILGKTKKQRFLHVVCAFDLHEGLAFIVTAYQPDPDLWIDFIKRRT
jgi:hypothetical protein